MLDPETIRLGYQLILDRTPSDAEVTSGQTKFPNLQALRQAFLKSREFRRKYARFAAAADETRSPALVQLNIPGTCSEALRDQLLMQDMLHPSLEIDETKQDVLFRLSATEQRALRYVHGDLCHGAGADLEGPHHYIVVIVEPGPRLHALWHSLGADLGFGEFLETALDDPDLRPEVDNGQIRRLAGDRSLDGLGQEPALLQSALHKALGPDISVGFGDAPDRLIATLAENGFLAGGPLPQVAAAPAHPDYDTDIAGLSRAQQQLFESYTAWDGYFHTICRQFLLPDPR